jgi:hypothetical protein
MNTLKRAAPWIAPPVLCLAYFWRAFVIWFRIDDFAWLTLPQVIQKPSGVWLALFQSAAQGTVRIISERLYFLTLTSLFGVTTWPFRAAAFLTWFAALWLIQAIGVRLTGSRAAGLFAALLWAAHGSLATPLVWASSYNEVLIAFVVLFAFYARLRWIESGAPKWRVMEAVAFLTGFGVLETIVVYPALVLLHAAVDARARAYWRSALWMLAPAGLFAAAHSFLIPKTDDAHYTLIFDGRLASTLWRYLDWTLAPWRIAELGPTTQFLGLWLFVAIAGTLAVHCVALLHRRNPLPMLCLGWFVLSIAPVLPLPNHISDYYLTVPGIGIAWLAGSALARAWQAKLPWRIAAAVLALGYFTGSAKLVVTETVWLQHLTARIRVAAWALEGESVVHPGAAVLLDGFAEEPLIHSLPSQMNITMGVSRVWLPPGQDQVVDQTDLGNLSRLRTTDEAIFAALENGDLRVVSLRGQLATDITLPYHAAQKARWSASVPNFVDVGLPVFAPRLGPGWFGIENGARWSGGAASLQLQIPAGARILRVTGFGAPGVLASGPVSIAFLANGRALGSVSVQEAGKPFAFDLPLPAGLSGAAKIELHCSRTFRPPGDGRELGMVFGTFAAR